MINLTLIRIGKDVYVAGMAPDIADQSEEIIASAALNGLLAWDHIELMWESKLKRQALVAALGPGWYVEHANCRSSVQKVLNRIQAEADFQFCHECAEELQDALQFCRELTARPGEELLPLMTVIARFAHYAEWFLDISANFAGYELLTQVEMEVLGHTRRHILALPELYGNREKIEGEPVALDEWLTGK